MSILTPKTAGFVNLSYCVATVQADIEDYTSRNMDRMIQWAIRCYTDVNLFHSNNVEVVYLTMDADGIVDISALTDFIDYVKVGIPVNGKIWILNKNRKILFNRDELSDAQADLIFKQQTADIDISGGYYFAGHYINGTYQTGIFGVGGGFSRSYFNIDLERMEIQFDTAVPNSEIVLEYYSTGINATGGTLIPRECVEYVVAYIHWQLAEHNLELNRFDKERKYGQYIERENMMRSFRYRFKKEEFLKELYSSQKQTIKS